MRTRSVLLFIVMVTLAQAPSSLAARPNKEIASYSIDAQLKLDERSRPSIIEARARLVWHNDSKDTIPDLQFHLYLNAFKNSKSTFVRESGGQLRGDEMSPGEWGSIELKEMKLASDDLLRSARFIQPDDANRDDQTVLRVVPDRPIRPGETITIDMVFISRLPRVFARSGYWGTFAMAGQWFPKIGVWETAGARNRADAGWNCHQYHADSEFYADFGTYDVKITVPPAYKGKLDATGDLRSERINPDGTVTYNFYQEAVHDFGWTADSRFIKVIRKFEPARELTAADVSEWSRRLDLDPAEMKLSEVEVILVMQPEHLDQVDRHFRAAFNALKYFGLWYGAYPYKTLAIVDPPFNASGAGGMEYPTLITAGTQWSAGRDQNPEEVVIHEIAHQYWYGMVANNEFEESWMDEGMTQYVTVRLLGTAYGNNVEPYKMWGAVPLFYWPFSLPHPFEDRLITLRGSFKDPIITPSWKYYDSSSYGVNSYARASLALNTLERYLGESTMNHIMRTYLERWSYRHPTSNDFFDVASEVSGKDLSWFFPQYFRGTATLDYEITGISSTARESTGSSRAFDTEVVVGRKGDAWFPVDLRMTLEDGSRVEAIPAQVVEGGINYEIRATGASSNIIWQTHERWKKFRFVTSSPIKSAEVDPERKVLLDANLTNNSYAITGVLAAGMRWGASSHFWAQSLFQLLSFLS